MSTKELREEHTDESWLVPYADILTLLLALFIVMFATSEQTTEKYQAVAQALNAEFNGPLPSAGVGPQEEPGYLPEVSPGADDSKGDIRSQLSELYNTISAYVQEHDLSASMGIRQSDDGVLITVSSDVWFETGSATITQPMRETGTAIANLLAENQKNDRKLNIIVTGHTDNDPIHNEEYPSNWYLSVRRAVNFEAVLLENPGLDPLVFSVRGWGEYRPIASNDTDDGKRQNRRVEVLVSDQPVEQTTSERPVQPDQQVQPEPSEE